MWDVGRGTLVRMDEIEMKARTKSFALRVIRLIEALPKTRTADVPGKQFLRSATSIGANYRASRRAKSTADFISKLGAVEEEADESGYWLELLAEAGVIKSARLSGLIKECDEITAIPVATIKSAKRHR